MLPASLHVLVANDCILLKKNLVTASYVSSEIQKMNDAAKSNNLIFLNEVGLDPGIDHMSAMKIIDNLKQNGAEILSFKSYCGGLVHPEFDNNPWNYKFTWNPRNVVLAGKGTSKFLNEKERDSLVNLKKELSKCSENLNSLSEHGTPRSLRAYCLVFIYIFPFIFVPGIYQYDISQTDVINSSVIIFISLLISFILVALYNVQNLIENPFDNQGLDDIKTDIYNKLNREIG